MQLLLSNISLTTKNKYISLSAEFLEKWTSGNKTSTLLNVYPLLPLQAAVQLNQFLRSWLSVKYSQVRFGSTVDWDSPQLSPHAQVLSNHSHQGDAGYIDEPPGQHCWRMRVVDPADDHMKEVHSDSEVETLLPAADEEPQTEGTARKTKMYCTVCIVCFTVDTKSTHAS